MTATTSTPNPNRVRNSAALRKLAGNPSRITKDVGVDIMDMVATIAGAAYQAGAAGTAREGLSAATLPSALQLSEYVAALNAPPETREAIAVMRDAQNAERVQS